MSCMLSGRQMWQMHVRANIQLLYRPDTQNEVLALRIKCCSPASFTRIVSAVRYLSAGGHSDTASNVTDYHIRKNSHEECMASEGILGIVSRDRHQHGAMLSFACASSKDDLRCVSN